MKDLLNEPNKIYFIGSKGAGKSSLVRAILNKEFNENISASPTQITIAKYEIENKTFTLKDLTDKNDFKITKIFLNEIEDVKCLFCLFSLTDKNAFEYAKTVLGMVSESLRSNTDIIFVLCGTKYDLIEADPSQRQISEEEINNYISSTLPGATYFNFSAKTKLNLDKIKGVINEIEIPIQEEEEDEIEDPKKNNEAAKNKSCIII